MDSRSVPLNPLAFAVGFGAAGLIVSLLFVFPMGFSMSGMHGAGMMGGVYGMGFGIAFGAFIWAVFISALAGAIIAFTYNAVIARANPVSKPDLPKTT
ncbi:MAG: hypothetical protein ACXWNK_04920 [Vulcanimicrobiaceae bacterium]